MGETEHIVEGEDGEGVGLGVVLEAHEEAVVDFVEHDLAGAGHLDEVVEELDLPSVGVLEHELDVEVLLAELEEVGLIVLQVHRDELEAGRKDVHLAVLLHLLELLLAVVQETHQVLQQPHLPVHILGQRRKLGRPPRVFIVQVVQLADQLVELPLNCLQFLLVALVGHELMDLLRQAALGVTDSVEEPDRPVAVQNDLVLELAHEHAVAGVDGLHEVRGGQQDVLVFVDDALADEVGHEAHVLGGLLAEEGALIHETLEPGEQFFGGNGLHLEDVDEASGQVLHLVGEVVGDDVEDLQHDLLLLLLLETLLGVAPDELHQQAPELHHLLLVEDPQLQELPQCLDVHVEGTVNDLVEDGLLSPLQDQVLDLLDRLRVRERAGDVGHLLSILNKPGSEAGLLHLGELGLLGGGAVGQHKAFGCGVLPQFQVAQVHIQQQPHEDLLELRVQVGLEVAQDHFLRDDGADVGESLGGGVETEAAEEDELFLDQPQFLLVGALHLEHGIELFELLLLGQVDEQIMVVAGLEGKEDIVEFLFFHADEEVGLVQEDLLALGEADEGLHELHDLAPHGEVEGVGADVVDQQLDGGQFLLLHPVRGVLQDQQQFLAVLEQVIEALHDAAHRPDALVQQRHLLHEDLGVGGVPQAHPHNAHHDVRDDVHLLRVVPLLQVCAFDFAGGLLDEDPAQLDEGVDDADFRQQLLVEGGQPAGQVGFHGQELCEADFLPIDKAGQFLQHLLDIAFVAVVEAPFRHLLQQDIVGVIHEHVQPQFLHGHLHQLERINQAALLDHLDFGTGGTQAQVLLGGGVADAHCRAQLEVVVVVGLDEELGVLGGRLHEADVPDHVDAEILVVAPRVDVEAALVVYAGFGLPHRVRVRHIDRPQVEVRLVLIDVFLEGHDVPMLGLADAHVEVLAGFDVAQLQDLQVGHCGGLDGGGFLAAQQELRELVLLHHDVRAGVLPPVVLLDAERNAALPVVQLRGTEDHRFLIPDAPRHHGLAPEDRPDRELAAVSEGAHQLQGRAGLHVLAVAEELARQQVHEYHGLPVADLIILVVLQRPVFGCGLLKALLGGEEEVGSEGVGKSGVHGGDGLGEELHGEAGHLMADGDEIPRPEIHNVFHHNRQQTGSCMFILLQLLLALASAEFLELKQVAGLIQDDCSTLDTNNLTAISMGNCQSSIYYINIGMGTPPQFFNMQVDTSRGLVWVPQSSGFQSNQSSTFEITEQRTTTYLHNNICAGQIGSEIISVIDTNISIRNSVAWTQENMQLPNQMAGLLGMGFSTVPNFLDNAAKQHQISSSIFSLQMRPIGEPSILYYGDIPESILESTHFVRNVGEDMWQVRLRSMRVGRYDYSHIAASTMILDSATDLIYFNNKLYNQLDRDYFSDCHNNICPCDASYPDLTFVLDGVEVTIRSLNYMRITRDGCYLLLGKAQYEDSPILVGSALMKEYVVTFDKEGSRLGFTAPKVSLWGNIFLILQFSLTGMMGLTLVLGIWLMYHMGHPKRTKSKSKSKSKGKDKATVNLSMSFLEPQ